MMQIHKLVGCSPVPLAHYLKALGILRLVAEQADSQARGWWEDDYFYLATRLDAAQLEDFFLNEYSPTPLVSPWNKGSGFFKERDPGLAPIEGSEAPRLQVFRAAIAQARDSLAALAEADQAIRSIKDETKQKHLSKAERTRLKNSEDYKRRLAEADRRFKKIKTNLIPDLRLAWRGPHRQWMDAAMVLDDEGIPKFPALLGTGGNDGRLDFTNNFMQRLGEVFDLDDPRAGPRPPARDWLAAALWGTCVSGYLRDRAVGQYFPGAAGGANSRNGPEGDSLINPLDFLLMMEGTILFRAHATRRFGRSEASRAATAFAVSAQGAAYASAAEADEGARGEQWMPLWSQPSSLGEVLRLLAEGRAQIGTRGAREPLDMARSIARLGTARGVAAFQRYGYIERNGQSNLAVPLGRFLVARQPAESLRCLDDLDRWLGAVRREARAKGAPKRLQMRERNLSDALFGVTQHPDDPYRWQAVLLALSALEQTFADGSGYAAQPIPALRPEWVVAADDRQGSELRLALAFALQTGATDGGRAEDPIRRHGLPLDPKKPFRFAAGEHHLERRREVVMYGRNGQDDAIALVDRRLMEAHSKKDRHLPLRAAKSGGVCVADLAALTSGAVDLDRVIGLARPLMALNRKAWEQRRVILSHPADGAWPDDAWIAIRLCMLPWKLSLPKGGELAIPNDPVIFRRLVSGEVGEATHLAIGRLRSVGISAPFQCATVSLEMARYWAAALAFPITQRTALRLLNRIVPKTEI